MGVDTGQPASDLLDRGWEALARGAWEEARAAFEGALNQEETAAGLEGLGWAAWWLNDVDATFAARERAYRLFRERDDRAAAARVATALASDHFLRRGEHAVANGWVQRAHHLLDGLDPGPEHAMLAIWEAHVAIMLEHDTPAARDLSTRAATIARALAAIDLEMLAQSIAGFALVCEGEVAAGMRLLDEATAAAVSGDMTDLDAIVTTCCYLILACERVRDYGRAVQWCDRAMQISARWSYRAMFSLCRTHYAGVLMWRGAWPEAEGELTVATEDLAATFPAMAVEGIAQLAKLRRCQGRLEEAEVLLRQLEAHPCRLLGRGPALLGHAALALEQGDPTTAADLAERWLRSIQVHDRLERADGLELLVRAQAALMELDSAAATAAELRSIAATAATEPLLAAASLAEGRVAAAAGDHATARRRFEDAIDLFERSGAPFEVAAARLELSHALRVLGRSTAAEREARAARESLQLLGAAREVERVTALLHELEAPPRARSTFGLDPAGLTDRERDVLRLIAAGKSNQEIAAELFVSVRTVERHISTIYAKIGVGGKVARAAATAYALGHGLGQA